MKYGLLRATLRFLVVAVATVNTACATGFFEYEIDAINYSKNGVMILEPALVDAGEVIERWAGVRPGFPGVAGDFRHYSGFAGSLDQLPDTVEIVWQLAKLTSCDYVRRSPSQPNFVLKLGCDWHPIPGKVFRKTLDMQAIRSSEAYKRAGEAVNGSHLYGTVVLVIELIFNEDTLRVETRNGARGGLGL